MQLQVIGQKTSQMFSRTFVVPGPVLAALIGVVAARQQCGVGGGAIPQARHVDPLRAAPLLALPKQQENLVGHSRSMQPCKSVSPARHKRNPLHNKLKVSQAASAINKTRRLFVKGHLQCGAAAVLAG